MDRVKQIGLNPYFQPKCLPFQDCWDALIVALYISCVIFYSILLLLSETIKNKIIEGFKKLSKIWKQRRQCKIHRASPDDVHKSIDLSEETDKLPDKSDNNDSKSVESSNNKGQKTSGKEETSTNSDGGIKYIQILFYYVQDASLFKIHLPVDGQQGENIIVKILEFSPEVLVSIYMKTVDMCFKYGLTAVTKVLAKSVFGYCVMLFIFLIYLVQKCISQFVYKDSDFWVTLRSRSLQAFLMTVLFSLQKIVIGAFSLVQCVEILEKKVLYIEGDVECYTWWQNVIQVYICFNVLPLLFIVSHAPFYVQDKTMPVQMFMLNCVFPLPAFMYFLLRKWFKKRNVNTVSLEELNEHFEQPHDIELKQVAEPCCSSSSFAAYIGPEGVAIPFMDDDLSISSENVIGHSYLDLDTGESKVREGTNYDSLRKADRDEAVQTSSKLNIEQCTDASELKHSKNEEAILETLLKYYKCLQVHGIRFTWLGIHQSYRVILVLCNTYITEPLPRLWAMTTALMLIAIANSFMKPYKDDKANKTAILSYAANLCISMINVFKTGLVTFDCKTNCSIVDTLLWYFSLCEKILLIYLPVVALTVWLIFVGVQRFGSKDKKE